jgi:hypothetical protein
MLNELLFAYDIEISTISFILFAWMMYEVLDNRRNQKIKQR